MPEAPGTSVNVNVLPSPSPDRRRRPEKQRRVQRRPPERRPRHRGGRDGGAGAIVLSFDKGGVGGSGTRLVVPEGVDTACRSKMAPWAIKRAERAWRRRGGGRRTGVRRR